MNLICNKLSASAGGILILLSICIGVFAQSSDDFLGIKLRPEVRAIVKEIEKKTGEEVYAEFVAQKDFLLGSGFITEAGVPVILIDFSLENNPKKLEAVITHELLHLRLRVNNYPTFVFSPTINMAKGRAIDVEQSNINDLKNMIEHQIFKAGMEKFGLYKLIDLAGDTSTMFEQNGLICRAPDLSGSLIPFDASFNPTTYMPFDAARQLERLRIAMQRIKTHFLSP